MASNKKERKPVHSPKAPNPYSIKEAADVIKSRRKNYDRIMEELNSKGDKK